MWNAATFPLLLLALFMLCSCPAEKLSSPKPPLANGFMLDLLLILAPAMGMKGGQLKLSTG
jgi:hypothetical protein